MKVVFVGCGMEQLSISILSAVLKRAGFDTALVFEPALFHDHYYFDIPVLHRLFRREPSVVDEVIAHRPDLVAFSVITSTYSWCLEVVDALKQRADVPTILGGVHPSAVPALCLENDGVDYVCVGEGEEAIVRLCEALAAGGRRPREPIPNLWWRSTGGEIVRGPPAPFLQDLDALPQWDKALWEGQILVGSNYLTMTSRGCPYRCAFCFNSYFAQIPGKEHGRYVRRRSVEHVMRELVHAKAHYRPHRVDFEDDVFTHDKPWLRFFLSEYRREIDRPFHCMIHPRFFDREVAMLLRDAGCEHVQTGVQSFDEHYRREVLRRPESNAELERTLSVLRDVGLPVKLDHILGLPGEPRSAQAAARDLYLRYPPRRIQTFWFVNLPGIELTRRAHAEGRLTDADLAAIDRGQTRVFRHAHLEKRRLDQEHAQFYQRYDVLLRMFPLLPPPLRRWLTADRIPALSPRLASAVGFLFDAANALRCWDGETVAFARQYGYQILRNLWSRVRRSPVDVQKGDRARVRHSHLV